MSDLPQKKPSDLLKFVKYNHDFNNDIFNMLGRKNIVSIMLSFILYI